MKTRGGRELRVLLTPSRRDTAVLSIVGSHHCLTDMINNSEIQDRPLININRGVS